MCIIIVASLEIYCYNQHIRPLAFITVPVLELLQKKMKQGIETRNNPEECGNSSNRRKKYLLSWGI